MTQVDVVTISSYFAAGICMGLGAVGSAIGEGYGAGRALEGITRQPAVQDVLVRDMLIGQAISETPGIFALVMSVVLIFSIDVANPLSWAHAAALVGAGLSMGIGAFGPAWGSGLIAGRATAAISRNPSREGATVRMMIIAQALCQTTVIYALVVALVLWALAKSFASDSVPAEIVNAAAALGAGICMGFGAFGPAVGTGDVGGAAVDGVALWPEAESPVTRAFFVGAAVSQTTSIYAMVIALILMFVVKI